MSAQDILSMWSLDIEHDFTKYIIATAVVWILVLILARIMPNRKLPIKAPLRAQMVSEVVSSFRTVIIFSSVFTFLILVWHFGWLRGPTIAARMGLPWAVGVLIAMILFHDTYFYWTHRMMHHPKLFRYFHRRHHKSNPPTPLAAYSFDISEALVQAAFVPIWFFIIPTPWTILAPFMLHQIARNVLAHSSFEFFPHNSEGRPLLDWLTTVSHHNLHHSNGRYNFGLYFSWWDRWMRTESPNYHETFAATRRTIAVQQSIATDKKGLDQLNLAEESTTRFSRIADSRAAQNGSASE